MKLENDWTEPWRRTHHQEFSQTKKSLKLQVSKFTIDTQKDEAVRQTAETTLTNHNKTQMKSSFAMLWLLQSLMTVPIKQPQWTVAVKMPKAQTIKDGATCTAHKADWWREPSGTSAETLTVDNAMRNFMQQHDALAIVMLVWLDHAKLFPFLSSFATTDNEQSNWQLGNGKHFLLTFWLFAHLKQMKIEKHSNLFWVAHLFLCFCNEKRNHTPNSIHQFATTNVTVTWSVVNESMETFPTALIIAYVMDFCQRHTTFVPMWANFRKLAGLPQGSEEVASWLTSCTICVDMQAWAKNCWICQRRGKLCFSRCSAISNWCNLWPFCCTSTQCCLQFFEQKQWCNCTQCLTFVKCLWLLKPIVLTFTPLIGPEQLSGVCFVKAWQHMMLPVWHQFFLLLSIITASCQLFAFHFQCLIASWWDN